MPAWAVGQTGCIAAPPKPTLALQCAKAPPITRAMRVKGLPPGGMRLRGRQAPGRQQVDRQVCSGLPAESQQPQPQLPQPHQHDACMATSMHAACTARSAWSTEMSSCCSVLKHSPVQPGARHEHGDGHSKGNGWDEEAREPGDLRTADGQAKACGNHRGRMHCQDGRLAKAAAACLKHIVLSTVAQSRRQQCSRWSARSPRQWTK